MNIFDKILSHPDFMDNPPVLVDIGASGHLHKEWSDIAEHSICIAFDADDRDIEYLEKKDSAFKKLYVINAIVHGEAGNSSDFYLTESPHCSSVLESDIESLNQWADSSSLFKINRKTNLKAVRLQDALEQLSINHIDWFKIDSQGTDLRIFTSLDTQIIDRILTADFEPGIFNAYKKEDKLYKIIEFMDKRNFWMSDIETRGFHRIQLSSFSDLEDNQRINLMKNSRKAPCWAEVSYMNALSGNKISRRDILLTCAFAMIKEHYGFAYEMAVKGLERYGESTFQTIVDHLLKGTFSNNQPEDFFRKKIKDLVTVLNLNFHTDQRIIIWGTGLYCDTVLEFLEKDCFNIQCFFDNNKDKQNSIKNGKKILSPEFVKNTKILIASSFSDEITCQAIKLGYRKEDIIRFQ